LKNSRVPFNRHTTHLVDGMPKDFADKDAITGPRNLTMRFQGTDKGRVGGLRIEPSRP
jgi:hypothetical protein